MLDEYTIVQSIARFGDLGEDDRERLERLEETCRDYRRGDIIVLQGEPVDHIYAVKSGWCASHVDDSEGHRQILDIGLPGDLIGMRDILQQHQNYGMEALTSVRLCTIPKSEFVALMNSTTKLANAFFAMAMHRENIMAQRIISLGRRDARARICHFIGEIRLRLNGVEREPPTRFPFPISQKQLADILGISEVHVQRTLRSLRDAGVMEYARGQILLSDPEKLEVIGGLEDDYLDFPDHRALPA